jgi:hypothetical protein
MKSIISRWKRRRKRIVQEKQNPDISHLVVESEDENDGLADGTDQQQYIMLH